MEDLQVLYGTSDSGWMEKNNFLEWFVKKFLPAVLHLAHTGHLILFFDGHNSHLALCLIKMAHEAEVNLFTLPSNTSHLIHTVS